jgi:mannitol/fructose-specific phosphotransferase system IIA component (Ntr-type)
MAQFDPGLIIDRTYRDKDECLAALVALLAGKGFLEDPDRFLELVRSREAEFSTGIGRGIGIPHARDAGVRELKTALARIPGGLEFASMDGAPVRLVFLTAAPVNRPDEYRESLGKLSVFIRSAENRERLMNAPDPECVYEILKEVGI